MSFKIPNTISYLGENLAKMKKNGLPEGVLPALLSRADALLSTPPYSVTNRNKLAPSKNPHDYCSMGTYWWPDESKPDGLPYIRRDGYSNPEGRETLTPQRLFESIQALTLAAYYTEDMRYARRAVEFIRVWFIDGDTYMTPHATYAQCIPGICDGRGIGLIDFALSYRLFDSVAILEAMDAIDPSITEALREWYRNFMNWMLSSDNGKEVMDYPNNHGTWFNVQIIATDLFAGDGSIAKRLIAESYESRVLAHIKEDGSIPHELSRTKAYCYSLFDLRGLSLIARLAKRCGDPRYLTKDSERGGVVLLQAIDFVYGAICSPEKYPYQEIHIETARREMTETFAFADAVFGTDYAKGAEQYLDSSMLWRLTPVI
ncbi:MAG: alginate lyase family protein [Clostridia bacterium]|nr:alginate lyase family protein [Clostridia bacterium]